MYVHACLPTYVCKIFCRPGGIRSAGQLNIPVRKCTVYTHNNHTYHITYIHIDTCQLLITDIIMCYYEKLCFTKLYFCDIMMIRSNNFNTFIFIIVWLTDLLSQCMGELKTLTGVYIRENN